MTLTLRDFKHCLYAFARPLSVEDRRCRTPGQKCLLDRCCNAVPSVGGVLTYLEKPFPQDIQFCPIPNETMHQTLGPSLRVGTTIKFADQRIRCVQRLNRVLSRKK